MSINSSESDISIEDLQSRTQGNKKEFLCLLFFTNSDFSTLQSFKMLSK